MRYLRQSTSVSRPIGPFLDETDGKTAETALTITQPDIRLAKNGGSWAQKNAAQTLSHQENGYYGCALDATDTNTLGELLAVVVEAGALPVRETFFVMTPQAYDSYAAAPSGVGVADTGSPTTLVDAARTEGDTDYWVGQLLVITSGNLAGQSRSITAFNPVTDTITVDPAFSQAIATHSYEIWPNYTGPATDLSTIVTNTATLLTNDTTLLARLTSALSAKLIAHSAGVLTAVIGVGSTTVTVKLTSVEGTTPSAIDNYYKDAVLVLTSGSLAGQRKPITAYDGATTTLTVSAFTASPATTTTALII